MDTQSENVTSEALALIKIFSFHLDELSLYEVTSESYKPVRAKLCHALCKHMGYEYETKALVLATRTDLGQFHADNYLGILQIASERWAFDNESKTKRVKTEDMLVKDRLAMFDLDPPWEGANRVFSGMFAYHRLVLTGSLAAAQMLLDRRIRVAVNWYGGHVHARKARAFAGCFVNDSVLSCLHLLTRMDRILHISVDIAHADGVEEAFYTTSRVFSLSFHDSRSPTGTEEDIGHGDGAGFSMNFPLESGSFSDAHFLSFFAGQVMKVKMAYNPSVIVLVISPSIIAASQDDACNLSLAGYLELFDTVLSLDTPVLVLGGSSTKASVSAIAWTSATARMIGKPAPTGPIPADFPLKDRLSMDTFDIKARPDQVIPKDTGEKLQAMDARASARLARLMHIKLE